MVALLIKLAWKQEIGVFRHSKWALVGFIFKCLAILGGIFAVAAICVALMIFAPDYAPLFVLAVGTLLPLLWAVIEVFMPEADFLAPEKFALLPVRGKTLAVGSALSALIRPTGLMLVLLAIAFIVAWSKHPLALVAAIPFSLLGAVNTILFGMVASVLFARLLTNKNLRAIGIVAVFFVVYFGFILSSMYFPLLIENGAIDPEAALTLSTVLAFIPLGAPYGVSFFIAQGSWLLAVVAAVIALAFTGVMWLIISRQYNARLVAPVQNSSSGRVSGGGFVERFLPATAVGAIASRGIKYRRRDARHTVNFLLVLVLPIFLIFVYGTMGVIPGEFLIWVTMFGVFIIATVVSMDVAYDHRAYAFHIFHGVSGRDDRAGRALAIGILFVLPLIVVTIATGIIYQAYDVIVPATGIVLGSSLAMIGVGSWVGVLLPGRAPKPGSNPFGKGSSGGMQSFLALLLCMAVGFVIFLPATALLIMSIWWPWLSWVGSVVAVATGIVALIVCLKQSGRALENRAPQVLKAITSET